MTLPIVLIGPMSAGKSTVGGELAKLTGCRQVPMDFICWYYYFQKGYSLEKEDTMMSKLEVTNYLRKYQLYALENAIIDFKDSIIDFGAGHSYYTEVDQIERAKKAFNDIKNIFLLLPSKNEEETSKICFERLKSRKGLEYAESTFQMNNEFIKCKSNKILADHIIYENGRTPQEIALEIKELLS